MQKIQLDDEVVIKFEFAYPPGNPSYRDTDLKMYVICHNQFPQGQNNFPDFEINKLELNTKYHSPH